MSFYQDLGDPEKMKFRRRIFPLITLANVFVVVLIVSYGAGAWKELKDVVRGDTKLEIAVSGEGKVTARPDIARINAAVVTQEEFLKEAQGDNTTKTNVLVAYLKSVGVQESDIKTVGYNIYPQYSYPQPCYSGICPITNDQPRITGYQVRTSYEITVRDLERAGEILGGVVGAGANEVGGINFTIDEPDQLQADARKKAIDDAKAKAEKLAKDLGRRLGPIINFSEGGYYPPIMYKSEIMAADGRGGGGVSSPSIPPGENEIMVNVSVTYELR